MGIFRILSALVGLFVFAAPASASLTISNSCVQYMSVTQADTTKTVECVSVVKKNKVRHAKHRARHYAAAVQKPRTQSNDLRGDIWKAIHDEAIRETRERLWREFEEWRARQHAPDSEN